MYSDPFINSGCFVILQDVSEMNIILNKRAWSIMFEMQKNILQMHWTELRDQGAAVLAVEAAREGGPRGGPREVVSEIWISMFNIFRSRDYDMT